MCVEDSNTDVTAWVRNSSFLVKVASVGLGKSRGGCACVSIACKLYRTLIASAPHVVVEIIVFHDDDGAATLFIYQLPLL